MQQAQDLICAWLQEQRFAHVVTLGSEMAMLAAGDADYRAVINDADLVVPDTIGIVYAARVLGTALHGRVAGIELSEALCERCAREGVPLFLFGGAPGVAGDAAAALTQRYPKLAIVGTKHGYFEESEEANIVSAIRTSGAKLVLVALGFPKQEFWIRKHEAALGAVVCLGVGGSLDVFAGRATRAPKLIRSLGLEWLYRLLREPQRLGRQMALPKFAVSVMSQAWHQRNAKSHRNS